MVDLNAGYELIIGSSVDPQFGPVLVFGSGGSLVEVFQDRSIMLPPLTTTLARRMMEGTKIYKALQGVRGREAADLAQLEHVLVRFSELIVEHPRIKELDVNPLLVFEASSRFPLLALDARVVLYPPEMANKDIPKTAIRRYPFKYVSLWEMPDKEVVLIRPIRPEDEKLVAQYHQYLSEESVYFRFFHSIKLDTRVAHERLTRICFVDYDCELALVVQQTNKDDPAVVAVCRLSKCHGINCAEFSMLITDSYQKRGLGTELLKRLVKIGKDEKLDEISAQILPENIPMQHVCEKVGFTLQFNAESDYVRATLKLKD